MTAALLDQAQAATDHATRILQKLGELQGLPVHSSDTITPTGWAVLQKYCTALVNGMGLCHHLNPVAPQPTWWLAHAPGKLRCGQCHTVTLKRLKGTEEDHRCDQCRRRAKTLTPLTLRVPAIVADKQCIPPALAQMWLCPTCLEVTSCQ